MGEKYLKLWSESQHINDDRSEILFEFLRRFTLWKVARHRVFSGPHFPVFGQEKAPHLHTFHAVCDARTLESN